MLVLFSGISIKYSAHLCGGNVVSTMFSLNGQSATCGMEDRSTGETGAYLFKSHCCDNLGTTLQLNTNYIPSAIYSDGSISLHHEFSFIPFLLPLSRSINLCTTGSSTRPPGGSIHDLCLPESLCNLRI